MTNVALTTLTKAGRMASHGVTLGVTKGVKKGGETQINRVLAPCHIQVGKMNGNGATLAVIKFDMARDICK